MKLKVAVFYQSVQLWDKTQVQTVEAKNGISIDLEDHLVKVSKEGMKEVVVVPTANLRHSMADYSEAYSLPLVQYKGDEKPEELITQVGPISETISGKPTELLTKKKANAKQ